MTIPVFTIVRDESFWLPRWIAHYEKQGFDRIVVLNNGDKIEVPEHVEVREVKSDRGFDHVWLRNTVQEHFAQLVAEHGSATFAEIDEFLWWRNGTVSELARSLAENSCVRSRCYSPLQMPGEAPFAGGPLLADRNTMFKTTGYDKTLVATKPMNWIRGFHEAVKDGLVLNNAVDEDLLMIHMWLFDKDLTWKRIEERKSAGHSGFFGADFSRATLERHYDRHFIDYPSTGELLHSPVAIPNEIKRLI